ncbi:MAG TPA: type II secretion system F family protein, partial [Thermoanaerobaculia bacterium]|nr:type II secretion system F family protein [Thermoanaerobaculia bacterium]
MKAGWPDGSVADEQVLALDAGAARSEVERRGGHVFDIRRKGFSLREARARRVRVKMSDFLIFNQEMIALLKAGLPVVHSFEILLERQESAVLRRVLTDIKNRVNAGASLSDAFAEQGDSFPRLYWTSLKAGERSGEIEAVLRRYLKYQKTVMAISRKVVSTLVYPAILIVLSTALISILMTFVIPRFATLYEDFNAQLPVLTVVVMGIATFLRGNILWIVSGVGISVFLISRWLQSPQGRRWGDAVLLKVPVVGGILRRFAITQFTRSLSTLLGGGTPLVPASRTPRTQSATASSLKRCVR